MGCVYFPAVAVGEPLVYYYQGERRVEVRVRLDSLDLESTATLPKLSGAVRQTLPDAEVKQTTKNERVVFQVPAADLPDLNVKAASLRVTVGADLRPILQPGEMADEATAQVLTDEISFQLNMMNADASQGVSLLAKTYGLVDVEKVPYASDIFTARVQPETSNLLAPLNAANRMQESGDVKWAAPILLRKRASRGVPNDPLFPFQWHLQNDGTNTTSGVSGADLNVVPAWDLATGLGVNIAMPDKGVEASHPDLAANVRTDIDYDFNGNDDDPTPATFLGEEHGTSCAGVAAGKGNNGIGISGTAPDAGIVGLRLTASAASDNQEAAAMAWKISEPDPVNQVFINSNSWGPTDNGAMLDGAGPLTEAALEAGVSTGRDGKGVVYTWAAGNGRGWGDNINKDGYANSPYVIAVGASNSTGLFSSYSEPGAPMLVNAPSDNSSSSFDDGIFTTDAVGAVGDNPTDYRNNFGGTSSSAPSVAGVIALMLEANPALTYRDVMHILVDTAVKNDPGNADWAINGSGRTFNHNYGFGRVNAGDAVSTSVTWQNVPHSAPPLSAVFAPLSPVSIPDGNTTGVVVEIPINYGTAFFIEHVEVQANITHSFRGDLDIRLESPSGMMSNLMPNHNDGGDDYSNWKFRSVAHWGEQPDGIWKVRIADMSAFDSGTLNSLVLRIRGFAEVNSVVKGWELY